MSNNPFLPANERRMAGAPQRLRSPPGLPPLVPAPTPAPQTARGAIQPDNTELPTSEQTYGATGELLGLTPAQTRRDPLTTGNRDLEEAAIPPYIPRWDDDKENIPPVDEDEHIHAAHEMHAATHDDGAFGPPIRIGRPDFADAMRANNFRAFPSSSSWLNAQEVYEDETAEPAVVRARATDRHAGHLAQPEYGHGTAAPHADNRRPDSGFDLEYHTTIPAQASGTALQIRNRDNLNVVHSRAMERYESRGTVEDGSEWEDEDEPHSRPNLHSQQTHAPENRFSQATQGSYADTSDYEESRRGSVVPIPPANAHELNGSPLPPGRFHRADWPGRRLGLRMPFSDSEPEPGPVDEFEMVEFAKDVMRQKHNEQRSTGERAGLGESVRSERMRQNEVILERIRQTSRSTIRQAAAEFAAEAQEAQFLQPAIPRIPQHLQPGGDNCDSFRHVMEAAVQEDIKHVPRPTGLRYPFLTDECTPQRPAGHLAWSETEHTFKTIYPRGSPVTPSLSAHYQGPYSPLPDPPEPAFTRARAGTEDTNRTGHDGFDELTPLTRSYPGKGRSRASVPGQTGLRPFLAALDDPAVNAASSSPTVFNPGRRLTDSEMAKRVKFWQPRPSVEPRKAHDLIREPIPASEEEGRRLLGVQQAYDPAAVRRHKLISGRLFNWCSLCPITALMFGLGSFDGLIANKMDGKVEGARQEDKHKALVVAAPASFMGWALVVLAVVLAVVFVKTARAL
ncbi:hypothetical protein Tdes44962_MAKER08596 [Teratosphaeria destructans]|uniref:Uncharacterized protein n=1 Tax=Teratosphaeria destructans TaxID=418781 RepID=A0A9W7SW35_9PEZI|nr:hypothetical protein Tdes44962_MAKER08596 [Teratosphaeria destructans]